MTIRLDGSYQTRKGWPVVIYRVDVPNVSGNVRVHGAYLCEGNWYVGYWQSDGRYPGIINGHSALDLVEHTYKVRRVIEYEGPTKEVVDKEIDQGFCSVLKLGKDYPICRYHTNGERKDEGVVVREISRTEV